MKYNLQILEEYVDKGLLRKAEDEDLVQYNYSEKTNNECLWDDITIFNRGNIYEKKTGELIARSMPKFLNFSQLNPDKQKVYLTRQFTATEKLDGCLGILYKYKGKIRYNSRGGFNNHVTHKIKQLLPKYVLLNHLLEYNNLVCEVISPQTKIICNYGDEESLYLITSYSKKTMAENTFWNNQVISDITYMSMVKQVNMSWDELFQWQKTAGYDKEGFVLSFYNDDGTVERIKIKSDDYVRIAALRTGLNKSHVWKLMKCSAEQHKDLLNAYICGVPDELVEEVNTYVNEIQTQVEEHKKQAQALYNSLQHIETPQLYKYFEQNPSRYKGCIYLMRKGGDPSSIILKMVKPFGEEES